MDRTLPIAELPKAPTGQIAYGVRRDGTPATIRMDTSVLIGGMTGSGKSSIVHAIIADIRRQAIPVDLYISDPKGGVELEAYSRHLRVRQNGQMVVEYAPDVEKTAKVVGDVHRALKARQAAQQNRKLEPSEEHPLIVLVFDELIEFMNSQAPAIKTAKLQLQTIISQGRAASVIVIGLTQLGQKTTLGDTRDMFAQRLCLATRNAPSTDVILGDQAESFGARCSQITGRPGVGYSYDERRRGYELFRAAWVDDADLDLIALGELPAGMSDSIKVPVNRQCAVYYLFTSDGQCIYIGKALNPRERWKEHAGRGVGTGPAKWWWEYVDQSKSGLIWCESEKAALALEAREIERMLPFANIHHNLDNPFAGREPLPLDRPSAVRWEAREDHGNVAELHPARRPIRRPIRPVKPRKPVDDGGRRAYLEELVRARAQQ